MRLKYGQHLGPMEVPSSHLDTPCITSLSTVSKNNLMHKFGCETRLLV